jgi:hypothetical protein
MTLDQRIAAATQSAESMVAELDIPAIEQRRPLRYRIAIGLTVVVLIVGAVLALGLALARTGTPAVTQPDGSRPSNGIILVGDPYTAINPDGSEAEGFKIGDLGDVSDFAWAPDGRQLAYVGASGIRVVDIETGAIRQLSDCRTCEVAWSPDGMTIAAATGGGVRLLDSTTGARGPLLGAAATTPVWSPDSKEIAYADPSTWQLYTVGADGSGSQQLGDNGGDEWTSPIWVPQLDQILFLALHHWDPTDTAQHEMVLMSIDPDAEGAQALKLAVLGRCYCLGLLPGMVLAPDGTKALIYGRPYDMGNFGLFTMSVDGSDPRLLDTGAREVGGSNLAWQPVP